MTCSRRGVGITSFLVSGSPERCVTGLSPTIWILCQEPSDFTRDGPNNATELSALIGKARVIAMQYSPECALPYIAMVDAGTVELIRSLGVEIRGSANLVQLFEARWNEKQLEQHLEAGRRMDRIRAEAFDLIRERCAPAAI